MKTIIRWYVECSWNEYGGFAMDKELVLAKLESLFPIPWQEPSKLWLHRESLTKL